MIDIVCKSESQSKWLDQNFAIIDMIPEKRQIFVVFKDGKRSKPFWSTTVTLDALLGITEEPVKEEPWKIAGPTKEMSCL